jgi:hypothetical protein
VTPVTPCPVCGFTVGTVSPMDSIVALRSFPRRFTELLSPRDADDREPNDEELARRRALVLDHVNAAAADIAAVLPDLTRVLVEDDPILNSPSAGQPAGGTDAIERLRGVTDELAALAERTSGSQWKRAASRGGGKITALDLLNEAVHAGVHQLRLASDGLA